MMRIRKGIFSDRVGSYVGTKRLSRMLVRQIDCVQEAARLANDICSSVSDPIAGWDRMQKIEHAGDDARRSLVTEIGLALSVPLEREDLFRASRSIDDVLDSIRDLVREIIEWDVPLGEWSCQALLPVIRALERFSDGLECSNANEARNAYLSARLEARKTRRTYDRGIAQILKGESFVDVVKQREVLRRVECIGSNLIDVSNTLMDGMVKRYM